MGSTRRRFTDEYRRDAVSLIVDGGYAIGEVAKKFDICGTTLRKWVNRIQPRWSRRRGKPLTQLSEGTELARLRKENTKLELQLEFAKQFRSGSR